MYNFNYNKIPKNDNNEMHIVYSVSNLYAKMYSKLSIYSLIKNNSNQYIYIYIVSNEIGDNVKNELQEFIKYFDNCELQVITIQNFEYFDEETVQLINAGEYPPTSHLRIIYPKIFSNLDRILCLGLDCLVLSNIDDYYHVELSDAYIAGVYDQPYFGNYWENTETNEKLGHFVCADAMILNIKKMIENKIDEEIIVNFKKQITTKFIPLAEQGLFNWMFKGKRRIAPIKYAYMPEITVSNAFQTLLPKDVKIAHYQLNVNPWNAVKNSKDPWMKIAIKYDTELRKITDLEYSLPKNWNKTYVQSVFNSKNELGFFFDLGNFIHGKPRIMLARILQKRRIKKFDGKNAKLPYVPSTLDEIVIN